MSSEQKIKVSNVNKYLNDLSKEFKKLNGRKMEAEIILIGGASILINYGFRDSTSDIDAIIEGSSAMKEAINIVGEKYNLANGWLNTDFIRTSSYTPKIIQYSKEYKTFNQILHVRTVTAEYLIAMKLISARRYKRDRSDVIGILIAEKERGNEITLGMIIKAIKDLYGNESKLSIASRKFIEDCLKTNDLETLYKEEVEDEENNKDILMDFENKHPGKLNGDNLDDILKEAKKKL